ncbi:MAG: hypothetical protein MHPSP_003189, partial [Paramarteilia canceri]
NDENFDIYEEFKSTRLVKKIVDELTNDEIEWESNLSDNPQKIHHILDIKTGLKKLETIFD